MGWWRTLDEALEQLSHQNPGKLFSSYNTLIRECGNAKSVAHARLVQQHMISTGYDRNQVLGDLLVQMYGKCGSLADAQSAFDSLPSRSSSSWNHLLRAYALQRHSDEALRIFHRMISMELQFDSFSLSSLLGLCSALGDLERGKAVHAQAVRVGLEHSLIVRKALVGMYGKCKAVDSAEETFHNTARKEVGLWNAMIVAYVQNKHHRRALKLYQTMDLEPDAMTVSSVLAACSNLGELEEGRKIYARGKHLKDIVVDTAAVSMFGRCGELDLARSIFREMEEKNAVTWNSMLAVYVHHGRNEDALVLFDEMVSIEGLKPSNSTYATVVQACTGLQDLGKGMAVHARIIKEGIKQSLVLQTALVNMYGKLGKLDVAEDLFQRMDEKHVVGYNVMIAALAREGRGREAIDLYRSMVTQGIQPDTVSYCAALGSCLSFQDLETGREIHRDIEAASDQCRSEVRLCNALVSMYGRCGDLKSANLIFNAKQEKDAVSWNAMICAYAKNGRSLEAIDLFHRMRQQEEGKLSELCVSTVLHACSLLGSLEKGEEIHQLIRKTDFRSSLEVNLSLLRMYSDCGRLDLAEGVFHNIFLWPCSTPWSCMLTAYVKNGRGEEAFRVLRRMQLQGWEPDPVIFGTVLSSCFNLHQGREIHSLLAQTGLDKLRPVEDGLMNMYAQCGRLELARAVFDGMRNRTVISWTIMISAYERESRSREALDLYYEMDVEPDDILYATVLGACASLGNLAEGIRIHEKILSTEVRLGVLGTTGLLNMYGKCGKIEQAREVFETMGTSRSYVSWTAIITAYSHDCRGDEAVELCMRMVQEGVMPDGVTFIGLMMATSGSVDLSVAQFRGMVLDFGRSEVASDHYECLVEVFGRAGWVEEAEEVALRMPFEAKELTWTTLLAACIMHLDFERGERAARRLLEVGISETSSSYVLLSKLYTIYNF